MNDINYVYYPCAGYDGSPVKIFGRDFTLFIYVDKDYNKHGILSAIRSNGFMGYNKCKRAHNIAFTRTLRALEECVSIHTFRRMDGFSEQHGPDTFTIAFLCGDGIDLLDRLTGFLGCPPSAIAYIRPGIAFGGNRDTFPAELDDLITATHSVKYIAADWGLANGLLSDMPKVREAYSATVCTHICTTTCEDALPIHVYTKPDVYSAD